jgi:hypothetical protein
MAVVASGVTIPVVAGAPFMLHEPADETFAIIPTI